MRRHPRRVLAALAATALTTAGLAGSVVTTAAPAQAVAKPKVSTVSPKTGSTKGGTTVTITGSGFVKVKKVTVGGVKATKVKVFSTKKLRFRTPAHAAGKVTIIITTAKGKVTKKSAFTYKKPATIAVPPPVNTLPSSGPITAGSGQTITGRHITSTSGPCITVPGGAHDVVITGNEIGPCGTGNTSDIYGLGVYVQQATAVTISNNSIHDVSTGTEVSHASNPIVFSGNTVWNVRGPFPRGQMIQFDTVSGGAGQSKIINNTSDKQLATIATHYEDHISLYASSGTSQYPIQVGATRSAAATPRPARAS